MRSLGSPREHRARMVCMSLVPDFISSGAGSLGVDASGPLSGFSAQGASDRSRTEAPSWRELGVGEKLVTQDPTC